MTLFRTSREYRCFKGFALDLRLPLLTVFRIYQTEIASTLRLRWLQLALRDRNLGAPLPAPIGAFDPFPDADCDVCHTL